MISKIKFNSGVTIQFKYYSQKVKDLQTATVYHVTADEELPVEYFPEIRARLNATDGHYLAVFTATLGQEFWRQTLEPQTKSEEKFPEALKLQVSLFDSMHFDDGSPSHWTHEKIKRAIANCPTEAEIQRRVYGRFVKASGLLYEAFTIGRNMSDRSPIPKGWSVWSGVDPGSGGQSGHPAAIVFVAVSEDNKQGRVFRAWRGDGIPTTATDIIEKYRELKKGLTLTHQAYDHSSADFFTVASRLGESFSPANKRREAGIGLLNTLFKTGMLTIERDDPELEKLVQELTSLPSTALKRNAVDDLCFAGSTKIITARGEIPIEDVKIGDLVLTRKGMRSVSAVTEAVSRVINLVHPSGETTWVTPNHRYITTLGEIPANSLPSTGCCLVLSELKRQKYTSSRASNLGDTPTKSVITSGITSSPAESCESSESRSFIGRFTSIATGKFQKALWFITLIIIRSTILRKILSSCVSESTCRVICENQSGPNNLEKISKPLRQQLPRGTEVLKVSRFTKPLGILLGQIAGTLRKLAHLAVSPMRSLFKKRQLQLFVQTSAGQKPVEIQALMTSKKLVWFARKPIPLTAMPEQKLALECAAIRVGKKSKISRVYNITVEDAHEYFANGALVANCDALRYTVMAVPWNFEGLDESLTINDALALERVVPPPKTETQIRREWAMGLSTPTEADDIQDEFDFWNDFSGA